MPSRVTASRGLWRQHSVQRAGLLNPKPYIPDSPCSEKRALRAGLAASLLVAAATSVASRWPHSPSRTPSLRGTDCRTDQAV